MESKDSRESDTGAAALQRENLWLPFRGGASTFQPLAATPPYASSPEAVARVGLEPTPELRIRRRLHQLPKVSNPRFCLTTNLIAG